MRTILAALGLILFFLITLPLYLILLCFQKKHRKGVTKIAQKTVKIGFTFILGLTGNRPIIKGLENIPRDRGVLFVSNHRSLLDAALAYMSLPVSTGFISKIEVKKVPFLSWWMCLVNCLFLDRDDMRAGMKVILQGIDDVKNGYSIFIAPEGTRNREALEPLPFKEGSLKIADKTGCPIVPVAISGSDDMFENSFPWIKKVTTVIEYGTPIDPNALSSEERKFMGAHCRDIIVEMMKGHESYVKNNPYFKKQNSGKE